MKRLTPPNEAAARTVEPTHLGEEVREEDTDQMVPGDISKSKLKNREEIHEKNKLIVENKTSKTEQDVRIYAPD